MIQHRYTLKNLGRFAVAALVASMAIPSAVGYAEGNRPPEITYFGWMNPFSDYFIMYGTVADEDPASCLVTFEGVLGDGYHTSVDEYGNFYLVVVLPENTIGGVSAVCIDSELQCSEIADSVVFY